jgi:DNA-binding winged helix-turn-helix (wHTH) protein
MVVFPGSVIVVAGRREFMPSPGGSSGVLRFDLFEVDLRAGELYKAGRKIKLQVLPFQALAILLERPGEVVTRKEFEKRLWPGDTYVDFDHSLNTAVKKLRQALGEDKNKPRYVETLPKRGYRFIGNLEHAAPPLPAKTPAPSSGVGQLVRLCAESKLSFVLVSADEEAAAEREKLEAAGDDVGLSLLIVSQKLLLVPTATQVRILEIQQPDSRCQVRILEGEHYGKTALVLLKDLAEIP